MKRQLLLAALMLVALGSNAQTEKGRLTIQPRVGMTLASFTGGGSGGATGKFGLTGGFDMEYGLSDLWSLSAGVGYTQMGASDYSAHPVTGVLSSGNQNIQLLMEEKNGLRYSFDYVTVPVTAAFYPYKGLSLRSGVQLGVCVRSHAKGYYNVATMHVVQPGSYFSTNLMPGLISLAIDGDFGSSMHKIDLGIPVGIAYEYRNFVLDARYVFGLMNLSKSEIDGHVRNSVFSLTLGYKFVIK